LKVYWFGYGGSSYLAEELRPVILELGMTLTTISEWDNANIKWDRNTWLTHLKEADIIIVPADLSRPAKSNNRLTQAMSLGKPIICSPLPAYLDIKKSHPGCFLLAESQDDWKKNLIHLRDNEKLRQELSQKAIEASKFYSIDTIGSKWLSVLKDQKKEIILDIIIPTYNNSFANFQESIKSHKELWCLQFCIESIRLCTETPYRIIVVSNGPGGDGNDLDLYLSDQVKLGDLTYIKKGVINFSKAINAGLQESKSKYVCIQNDDTIVSRGWEKELIKLFEEEENLKTGAVGPLSNCDKNWLHEYNLNIGGIELIPGMYSDSNIEQIKLMRNNIHDYKSPYSDRPERDWIAFYCTMLSREIIDKTGILDEEFQNSGEDVDYCDRIRKTGYKIYQNYKSFVFHFGAVARHILEEENKEEYQNSNKKTIQYMHKKLGKKSVMIYSGPSWEKWDFRTMETSGIGGSEVWQIWMTRELYKLGYRVTSFADCEAEIMDGEVQWLPFTEYPRWVDQHWTEYAILSRSTDPLNFPLRAGKTFVQIHDIWLLSDRNKLFLDRVNKFCALSQWHSDFASDHHGIPKDKMALVANGVDFDRFDRISVERHPFRFHWSSSWDRGLDNVLYLWPFIKERLSEAELHVYYGVYNWKQKCLLDRNEDGLKKIAALEEAVKQPGIYTHGRVSQQELAEGIKRSSLWLYPSWFSETFCCLPDNKIFTDSGFKQIIDVSLRDQVLTHKNRFKAVSKLMSRPFSGTVYSLKLQNHMHDNGFYTGEHPFLILTEKDVRIFRGIKWGNYKIQSIYPKWVPIKDIKMGDYVCSPHPELLSSGNQIRDLLEDMKTINRNYKEVNNRIVYRDHDGYKGIPRYVQMDKDFARFLGFYLAEGSFSQGIITFSFHTKEEEYLSFVEKMCDKLDISHKRESKGNSSNIKIGSNALGVWFKQFFGSNAAQKRVPKFLYTQDREFISSFLKGAMEGDGGFYQYVVKIQLASEKAIWDLKMLMAMVGIFPSYTRPEQKPTQTGEERLYYGLSIGRGQWDKFLGDWNKKIQNSFLNFSGDIFFRVRKLENKNYIGNVYNMEIEEDNSYVSNFMAVHNCITAVECQRAGVPVLCHRFAGLTTTLVHPELGDTASMLGHGDTWWPYTQEGREQFLQETFSILSDQDKWRKWSELGFKNSERFSWARTALRWKELFENA
jgi:GT2 family glycosyltransferase/glycosyltransferase involved in cell wall biosynthesis